MTDGRTETGQKKTEAKPMDRQITTTETGQKQNRQKEQSSPAAPPPTASQINTVTAEVRVATGRNEDDEDGADGGRDEEDDEEDQDEDEKQEGEDGGGGDRNADDITLQTQHIDPNLAHMIDYLQHDDLPDDSKTARHVLLTKDSFAIRNGKLLHLGIKRRKNNSTDQPIAEQLCVPKQLQPTLLARYHAQLMHCGYEKMYLTMKQRVYWGNMYLSLIHI